MKHTSTTTRKVYDAIVATAVYAQLMATFAMDKMATRLTTVEYATRPVCCQACCGCSGMKLAAIGDGAERKHGWECVKCNHFHQWGRGRLFN